MLALLCVLAGWFLYRWTRGGFIDSTEYNIGFFSWILRSTLDPILFGTLWHWVWHHMTVSPVAAISKFCGCLSCLLLNAVCAFTNSVSCVPETTKYMCLNRSETLTCLQLLSLHKSFFCNISWEFNVCQSKPVRFDCIGMCLSVSQEVVLDRITVVVARWLTCLCYVTVWTCLEPVQHCFPFHPPAICQLILVSVVPVAHTCGGTSFPHRVETNLGVPTVRKMSFKLKSLNRHRNSF